ncbi:hypothetical protein MPLSOD_40075 [Mesorhizobium sp. SOD10]|nr:hypothetical protein MPLSOD_40075 [Mesorhizobium sp. SOD10]
MDKKLRRALLGPLARRPKDVASQLAYETALGQLDSLAVGEELLQKIRHVLSPPQSEKRDRNDPERVAEQVALAKALYKSRRISKSQYVVFSAFPVESIHDDRMMKGLYDSDLEPITRKLEGIEKRHGLKPGEYWHRSDEPWEYRKLSLEYESILDQKFKEALAEFDLLDLADLKEKNPDEFDRLRERGRRFVFHSDEQISAIEDIVIQYELEARKAANVGAYAAAITALGAGVEGLLLLRCLRSPHKAARISKKLPKNLRPRLPNDPSKWTFETLIEVCVLAGWLPPIETDVAVYNTAGLAHLLRQTRNYVHPGKRAKERAWSETDEQEFRDAEAIYVVLLPILAKIGGRRRYPSAV